MSKDRCSNHLISIKDLLKQRKSSNEVNDHFDEIYLEIVDRQNQILDYLLKQEKNNRKILYQIISNENLLKKQFRRIFVQLIKKRRKSSIQSNRLEKKSKFSPEESFQSNDETLIIYWHLKNPCQVSRLETKLFFPLPFRKLQSNHLTKSLLSQSNDRH